MWVFVSLVVGLVVAVAVLAREVRKAQAWERGWRRARRVWEALAGPAVEAASPPRVVLSHEPVPAEIPQRAERWCSGGGAQLVPCRASLEAAAAKGPHTDETPSDAKDLDAFATRAKPTSGFQLVSRPGELVLPESYGLAPPLPAEAVDGDGLYTSERSIEVRFEDLEDLVDTQPSVVLSAAEADAILAAAARRDDEGADEHDEEERVTAPPATGRRSALPPPPRMPGSGGKSALPVPPPSEAAWDKRATQPKPTPRLDEIFQDAPTGRGVLVRAELDDTRRRAG